MHFTGLCPLAAVLILSVSELFYMLLAGWLIKQGAVGCSSVLLGKLSPACLGWSPPADMHMQEGTAKAKKEVVLPRDRRKVKG